MLSEQPYQETDDAATQKIPLLFSGSHIKTVDTSVVSALFQLAQPIGVSLNLCYPGTSSFNRIGRRIRLLSIQLRAFIHWNNASTTSITQPSPFACAIVYDSSPNGHSPSWTDVFTCIDQNGANPSGAHPHHFPNTNNQNRFTILRYHRSYLSSFYLSPSWSSPLWINTPDPLSSTNLLSLDYVFTEPTYTQFKSDTIPCAVADIASGNLIFLAWSLDNTASYSIDYNSRLQFIDE